MSDNSCPANHFAEYEHMPPIRAQKTLTLWSFGIAPIVDANSMWLILANVARVLERSKLERETVSVDLGTSNGSFTLISVWHIELQLS